MGRRFAEPSLAMILGIDHATIVTRDLDATRDFFVKAIGLEVGYRPPFRFPGHWLYAGGRPILHLAPLGGDRPADGAIDHFSFATDDLSACMDRLDGAGVAYACQPLPDGQGSQAFCRDPNGVLIEITCRAGPAMTRRSAAAAAA
jgi:catechol 2,3-dioxygenase-like lactoylglutathione lyase family enzyme